MIPYVLAASHVVKSCMKCDIKGRSKNFMFWMIFLVLLQCCQAAPTSCPVAEVPSESQLSDELWLILFAAAPLAIALIAFFLGRMSKGEKLKESEKVTTIDTGTQKDQPVAREALRNEQGRAHEYQMADRESPRPLTWPRRRS